MNILVFNCGSSSLTFKLFSCDNGEVTGTRLAGKAHRVGVKGTETPFVEYNLNGETQREERELATHGEAAVAALGFIRDAGIPVHLVGHRYVHGGSLFTDSAMVNPRTLERLRACLPLAPIHNPVSLDVIEQARQALPDVPEYVTFDSAFHATIPPHLYTYALPRALRERYGFRKYGFHGLSYSYVTAAAARFLGRPLEELRLVACHLGTGGSSVAAVREGRSLDTSMGYSPLPGLVMSTRSGDVDPMLQVYLMSVYGYHPEELMDLFNKESGLLGLSRFSSDLRDILRRVEEGDEESSLAVRMYVQRLKKYVGAYVLELGGLDALIFTDDIGVHNPLIRQHVCADMGWCGLAVDPERNQAATEDRLSDIGMRDSDARVLVVPTEEELTICLDGLRLAGGGYDTDL